MSKEKRDKMIGALVPPSIKREVEAICSVEQRSISIVGYLLMLRGLELYRVDGSLKNNERLIPIVAGLNQDLYPAEPKKPAASKPSKANKIRRTA